MASAWSKIEQAFPGAVSDRPKPRPSAAMKRRDHGYGGPIVAGAEQDVLHEVGQGGEHAADGAHLHKERSDGAEAVRRWASPLATTALMPGTPRPTGDGRT